MMNPVTRPLAARALLVLVTLLALAGCGSDQTTPPLTPDTGPPFPDTADKLMANFRAAYQTRDYAVFCDLLTPDYEAVQLASTVSMFPDLGERIDVAEEHRIHERMFSGHSVTDPLGEVIAGVQGITFEVFQPIGGWTAASPSSLFPDTESRLYDVVIVVDRGQANNSLDVHGQLQFFASHRDSTVDGVTCPYYRLRGLADLTSPTKGVESSAWGAVKALYR